MAPGLDRPLEPVEGEEEKARHHKREPVLGALVPEEEQDEDHIQLVHAEEEFEVSPSNDAQAGQAHDGTDDADEDAGGARHVVAAPVLVLGLRRKLGVSERWDIRARNEMKQRESQRL